MIDKAHLLDFSGDGAFGALTALRPAGDLRCGGLTLAAKLRYRLEIEDIETISLERNSPLSEQKASSEQAPDRPRLMISSRALLSEASLRELTQSSDAATFRLRDGKLIAIRQPKGLASPYEPDNLLRQMKDAPVIEIEGERIDHPWHLLQHNSRQIFLDFELLSNSGLTESLFVLTDVICRSAKNLSGGGEAYFGPGVVMNAEAYPIRFEDGCWIGSGAILDAEAGPIWIGSRAKIEPGAIVRGPAFIGAESIVRAGARLNGNITLGPQCRVGGELSNVILQGYSNKQHSGYLGGSYLGEWVNLGAATDNSDLKNNYRPIDVTLDGQEFDTGDLHVGVFYGDFVRTAIQTRMNSGTVVGTCCNLFGDGFPDKAIPPFIWFGAGKYQEYRLDKAFETISIVMSRRGRTLTDELQKRLTEIFERSSDDRANFLARMSRK